MVKLLLEIFPLFRTASVYFFLSILVGAGWHNLFPSKNMKGTKTILISFDLFKEVLRNKIENYSKFILPQLLFLLFLDWRINVQFYSNFDSNKINLSCRNILTCTIYCQLLITTLTIQMTLHALQCDMCTLPTIEILCIYNILTKFFLFAIR